MRAQYVPKNVPRQEREFVGWLKKKRRAQLLSRKIKNVPRRSLAILDEARHILLAGEERREGFDENVASAERADALWSWSRPETHSRGVIVTYPCYFHQETKAGRSGEKHAGKTEKMKKKELYDGR